MSNKNNEYLIYIHGDSQNNNQSHNKQYDHLHDGIQSVQNDFPNRLVWEQANRCNVEWGWNYDQAISPESDRLLAEAQDKFSDKILPQIKDKTDFTLNPARVALSPLRKLMLKGFSDMFYYSSRDGKSSIRETVSSQILQSIKQPLQTDEPISLTFLTHSAGSVVAFDFLFYLFAPEEILKEHEFIEIENDSHAEQTLKDFEKLRTLADNKKLRVRRLVTFGSPISMLAFRSNAVIKILAQGDRLNPDYYGFEENSTIFGEPLQGPRWINFWDKDDIISWPVSSLMKESSNITDIYLDAGDGILSVHNKYWNDKTMHKKIAAHW